jgi:uncharacterized protein
MRILVDVGHPAHVHFFRHAIGEWKKHGHQVEITARGKSYVTELLDYFGLKYELVSRERRGALLPLLLTFVIHTFGIVRIARKFRPNLILSISSPMAAWAAAMSGIRHVTFDDTEHARFEHMLYVPWTKRIYTPAGFTKDFGDKQVRYPGYHELAYLHPNWFKPDSSCLTEFGILPGESFFVVRLVSWKASHDLGHHGFLSEESGALIEFLKKYGKVIISSEAKSNSYISGKSGVIHPAKMHNLLSYATLYVGEGGTMATEAALLGVPSIFVSTLSAGNWQELEHNYGLMFSFQDSASALSKIKELLANPNLKQEWTEKRDRLLANKIDVTNFVVDEIEKLGTLGRTN